MFEGLSDKNLLDLARKGEEGAGALLIKRLLGFVPDTTPQIVARWRKAGSFLPVGAAKKIALEVANPSCAPLTLPAGGTGACHTT